MKQVETVTRFKNKRRSIMAAYSYWKGIIKLPYPPQEVFIEPTNYCNLKCIICPQGAGLKREKGFMNLSLFEKILKEAVESKVLKITLHYAGESLLNKDLFKMIALAKQNKIYLRFHTNAAILSEDYCYKIINSGLDEISFSFDCADKEAYERVRVNAVYEDTLFNIRRFLKIKKNLGASKPYTILQRIQLNGTGQTDDINYKGLFKGFCVDKFYTIPAHNWAGECRDTGSNNNFTKHPCSAIWYRFAIGWDGLAYACCNELDGKLLIGDLNKDNLLDVWNGRQMLELRRMMYDNRYEEISACKDCDVLFRPNIPKISICETSLAKLLLKYENSLFCGRDKYLAK